MKNGLLTAHVVLAWTASCWIFTAAGPASDPCTGTTCGKAAECRFRSNLVVCVCPEGTEGDPFVECNKLLASTTDGTMKDASGMDFHQNEATTTTIVQDILKITPKLKSETKFNVPEGHGDDPSGYFPSAPPTLSHYAHSPPFSMSHPPNSNPPYLHHDLHGQDRLQNSFHGNINHDVVTGSEKPKDKNGASDNVFNIPAQIQGQLFEMHSEQSPPQRHGGGLGTNQQFQPHPATATIPTNHNGPNRVPPPKYPPFNQPSFNHHHPTNFNLKPETQNPHQRQDVAKDPLGVYMDCVTMNNRVVCADTSGRHDLHPSHLAPQLSQWNHQGFEHRLIAVGNENKNTFHPPPPTRFEGNGIKNKPGQAHLRPGDERPHFQPGHHHGPAGPPGTVNLFPPAASSEVQSEDIKINHQLDPPAQQQQAPFPEMKPFAPQPGTEEAKLCQQMCGEGAVCRVFHNRAICGCPEGHTGDPAKKCFLELNSKFDPNSCQRHIECPSTMICLNSQCTDPCLIKNTFDTSNISSFHDSLDAAKNKNENLCGPNSKCSVIEHTQLCSCEQNYYGNPYIGCVQ